MTGDVHDCPNCHLPTEVDMEHWANLGIKPCKEGHHRIVLFPKDYELVELGKSLRAGKMRLA